MNLSHALLGLGALYLLTRPASGAPSSPPSAPSGAPSVVANLDAVKAATIQNFVVDTSSTLSPSAQLHNAISRNRGIAANKTREANVFLADRNLLIKRLRAGIGGGSLSFNEVLSLGINAGYIKGVQPEIIKQSTGQILRYKVVLN